MSLDPPMSAKALKRIAAERSIAPQRAQELERASGRAILRAVAAGKQGHNQQPRNEPMTETRTEPTTAHVDLLEAAWGIIANAGGGNWKTQTPEWQKAAARWRERYHAVLSETVKV